MTLLSLDLFAGAGGGLLAGKLLGWRSVGYVEINDYCQRVIAQRIKDGILDEAPIFGDIRSFLSEGYSESYKGMVDVVTAGFPCKDISCANTEGKGIDGEYSGLWREMSCVIGKIRPSFIFVENSPMLTIRGGTTVIGDLTKMGYDARWGIVGANHITTNGLLRERMWIVAFNNIEHGKRLQIQKREHIEREIWLSPAQINFSDVTEDWALANNFGMRVVDDVAGTMDRITAIGNGQIPIVAASAFKILSCGMI